MATVRTNHRDLRLRLEQKAYAHSFRLYRRWKGEDALRQCGRLAHRYTPKQLDVFLDISSEWADFIEWFQIYQF
jgi:hypothetical protein